MGSWEERKRRAGSSWREWEGRIRGVYVQDIILIYLKLSMNK